MQAQHDGAWYDEMYNNRTRVPEYETFLRRWAMQSAQACRYENCELDVAYGQRDSDRLDIFLPPAAEAPVFLFVHGGYWRALDKADHSFIAPAFIAKGACVVIPNYTLAPAATVPEITLQVAYAVAWTWRNIARYGGDPARIVVAGHSAGGQLATMMLACLWQQIDPALPSDVVRNALAISALHDLEPIMHTPFLQESLNLTPQQVAMASPARLAPPPHGTLVSVVGGRESEEYLRQNALIRQAWGSERVLVCEAIAECNHFSVLEALTDPEQRLHQLAVELLALR